MARFLGEREHLTALFRIWVEEKVLTFLRKRPRFGTMPLRYCEERAAQAAARLLKRRGGRMSYLKLLKLLYLADRKALVELGQPITCDLFVSMDKGPVLSRTYDLIREEPTPFDEPSYWRQLISPPADFDVRLLTTDAPNDYLSTAHEEILDATFAEFGHWNRWDIVQYTHGLPEFQDPQGSSIPIDLRTILLSEGLTERDADAVMGALDADARMEQLAGEH